MKAITIRVETNHNMYFRIIEEIRFNGKVIHEQCICCSELYEHSTETYKLDKVIPNLCDKDIYYKYLNKDYPEWDYTKQIKKKIDNKINLYKYEMGLNELKARYSIK